MFRAVRRIFRKKKSAENNGETEANEKIDGNRPTRDTLQKNLQDSVLANDLERVQTILSQDSGLVNHLLVADTPVPSLLYQAAENGFVEIATALLDADANVNQQCGEGKTPLIIATINGRVETVQLLLAQPTIIADLRDDLRQSPLDYATANSHQAIVKLLSVANAGESKTTSAETTVNENASIKAPVVRMRSLSAAARVGIVDSVAALLESNAVVDSVDKNGYTPLMHAVEHNREAVVKLLLAANANPNIATKMPEPPSDIFQPTPTMAPVPIPDKLGTNGRTALTIACKSGNGDCVPHLLEAKANINQVDIFGYSALYFAVETQNFKAAKLLVARGAVRSSGVSRPKGLAKYANARMRALFDCSLCGWEGMCCPECRQKYCIGRCIKCFNSPTMPALVDCRAHRQLAHQAVLEWALAMAPLDLPPYVLEHIFTSLKWSSTEEDYQQRKGIDFLAIPETAQRLDANFIHLIVEERTHVENIRLFIAIQQLRANK